MRHRALALVFLILVLVPAPARADDGGWLEWLEKMSGPRLIGVATDFHLLCVGPQGVFNCERWFGIRRQNFQFADIKHELDVRVGVYWKRTDERFSDTPNETARLNAAKYLLMYRYHPNTMVSVGAGFGGMSFFGEGFDRFTKPIVTPVSVIVAPFRSNNRLARAFYVRLEDSYIAGRIDGKKFNSATSFASDGEWNTSYGFGFDFRR